MDTSYDDGDMHGQWMGQIYTLLVCMGCMVSLEVSSLHTTASICFIRPVAHTVLGCSSATGYHASAGLSPQCGTI